MMIAAGIITEGQLQHLLARQRHEGGRLGEWAVTLDYAPCRAVLELLARQLGTPFITDERILQAEPPEKLLSNFPQEKALRLMAVPLAEKDGKVFVAMIDPADLARVDAVSFTLGRRVQPVVCSEFGLRRALSRIYGGRSDDLKWRQLDSADPMAMLSARMVDFDEGGHVRRISEAGEGTPRPPAASPTSTSTTAPAMPAMQPPGGPPTISAVQVTPAPTMTPVSGVPMVAGGPTTPGGCAYAYVVAGVGPDGRPVFVPMAITPQGIPLSPQPGAMAAANAPPSQTEPVTSLPAGPPKLTKR
jgi:serine/threonine-protein kinase